MQQQHSKHQKTRRSKRAIAQVRVQNNPTTTDKRAKEKRKTRKKENTDEKKNKKKPICSPVSSCFFY
jgi:hypothetical protein